MTSLFNKTYKTGTTDCTAYPEAVSQVQSKTKSIPDIKSKTKSAKSEIHHQNDLKEKTEKSSKSSKESKRNNLFRM